MTDKPTTPEDETKVTAPASQASDSPTTPEATTPATEPPAEAAPAETPPATEEGAATPTRKRLPWAAICLDGSLLLLLLAVLGAAGYYFYLTTERYHVPTPMELMLAESDELDRRYTELLPQYNQADTQMHLRARLAQLEGQAARLSAQIAEKKAALDDQRSQVLAIQYNIRQADETNRSIARSLLPGMPVGHVTTTTGKAYRNATIYRLDKRYIYIRFPEGQVRFPLRHLVKDNLPELARYAFGDIDLVDMSDFEHTGQAPTSVPTRPAPAPRAATPRHHEGYDPAPGAPVLDTEANRTTTSRIIEEAPLEQDTWDAPSGDLPM